MNPDPIKSHIMTLVSILANCENSGKLALLSLFGHVAKDNPAVSCRELCHSSFNTVEKIKQVVGNNKATILCILFNSSWNHQYLNYVKD